MDKLKTISIVILAVFLLLMSAAATCQPVDMNGDGIPDTRIEVTSQIGQAWLGITYNSRQMYDTVLEVVPNSPAERAGLKKGDRIVAILQFPSRDNARRYELNLGNGYVLGVYPAGEDLNETPLPFRMGQLRDCCKPGDRILIIVYRDYGSFLSPNWRMIPIYATLEERR